MELIGDYQHIIFGERQRKYTTQDENTQKRDKNY